jgi:hypothetical protein
MAYMRGDLYVWRDGDQQVHLWARGGSDEWEDSCWAKNIDGTRHADRTDASGVAIHQPLLDQYVVMRLAEIIEEGIVDHVIDRALANHGGNGGCQSLGSLAEPLKRALSAVSRS